MSAEVLEENEEAAKLLPEVAPKVSHDVGVRAFLHHEDFLLNDGKVIAWKQREETRTHGQAVSTFGVGLCTSRMWFKESAEQINIKKVSH